MNKYKSLLHNTLLVFGGNIGAKVITLLMMPLYTRWLSVEGYGLTDMLTVYVTLLISLVSCCIPSALFVFPNKAEKDVQKKYFSSGVCFNYFTMILTALFFLTISLGAKYYSISNSFVDNIWYIYMLLVVTIMQEQCQQFCRSTGHMYVFSLTGLIFTIAVTAFSFCLVPRYGVTGYVSSMILANLTAALFSFIGGQSYRFYSFYSFDVQAVKEMLKYSVPLIPNSIMWWLVNAMNRPLMESCLGLHEIGVFAVANRFPGILSMVFSVFTTSWTISVLEEFKNEGFSIFYNRIFKIVFSLLTIILLGIVFASKILVITFADESFLAAWHYVALLSFGTFISCISTFAGAVFSAYRKSKYYLYSSVYGAIASLVFNFILIPLFGLNGACISIIMSFLVMAISRIAYAWNLVKLENVAQYLMLIIALFVTIYFNVKESTYVSLGLSVLLVTYLLHINKNDIHVLCKMLLHRKQKQLCQFIMLVLDAKWMQLWI